MEIIRFLSSSPRSSQPRPAILLDRDGVINRRIEQGYVTHWRAFEFLPGVTRAIRHLSTLGVPMLVVSNQACVGKGLLAADVLQTITRRFCREIKAHGGRIDAVYYCPHTSDQDCGCRKPRPGLLTEAAREWNVDLSRSVLIGDSESDLAAARSAGCPAILFKNWMELVA
jgi:D-glycero-D-manno-heptose 1,7-bisphosphate phosphatase